MTQMTDNQLRALARKRVEFRSHLTVYIVVMVILWTIWFVTSRGYLWPVWPMGGWGIGILFHYIFDYRKSSYLSEEREYEKLKKMAS